VVAERILGTIELAAGAAHIDTGSEEELIEEVELTHICHRTACNHQVVGHRTCITSWSAPPNSSGTNAIMAFCTMALLHVALVGSVLFRWRTCQLYTAAQHVKIIASWLSQRI
jgi:hypothetical protein